MVVPIDILRTTLEQIRNLPTPLPDNPIVQHQDGRTHRAKDRKTANHAQEDRSLGEIPPRLTQHANDKQHKRTTFHGDVAREDTSEIHTRTDVVLRDVDEDLMHVYCKTCEECCGAAGGGVIRRLDV